MENWDDVTGESYRQALDSMKLTRELLEQKERKGFKDAEEAYAFGEQTHCLLRVFSPSNHCYYYVNHVGEMLNKTTWAEKYEHILYYTYEDDGGKIKKISISPNRFKDTEDARSMGELYDGLRQPMFYRNYFLPKGHFDEGKGVFNVARPIRWFAKETGADTSHIYVLIEAIAGVNSKYVLAWLREKMMNPMRKTEVVPVFVSKEQGTGKSTFANAICKALFEKENVIVGDQYDSSARFNADYADALIVCLEEKKQDDKRNDASSLKSRVTSTEIRKEQKGIDPIYQESYTDFVMTTNGEVPIKFDSATQRRFMVMEVDDTFTRENPLADEVFTKLYGYDGNGVKKGPGLVEDSKTIQQFKWELLNNQEIAETSPRDFIKTDAYNRCFTMPRTNEAVEIEAMIRALAPFIQETLVQRRKIEDVTIDGEEGAIVSSLDSICSTEGFVFLRAREHEPDRVAINRLAIFLDNFSQKPFAHSVVERALMDAKSWLRKEYGIVLLGRTDPPVGGYKAVMSRYRTSPTAWFVLAGSIDDAPVPIIKPQIGLDSTGNVVDLTPRLGERARYSDKSYLPDEKGALETINELKPGAGSRGKDNAQYLDTFLLEADDTSIQNMEMEERLLKTGITEIGAEQLYQLRLRTQHIEAKRLFDEQIACRVVYSGAKSLHVLVRVDPAPQNIDERRWLFAYLCKTLSTKLNYDDQVGDPTRLTRVPNDAERITHRNNVKIIGQQKLLFENWAHTYKLHWRPMYDAWLNQPKDTYEQKGKAMLPTKEIYRDAARAFMEGTFFTDKRWSGKRQLTFFPLYRIVRALGYTYDQVWAEVKEQVQHYAKVEDRAYWTNRQDSDIIREIERDLE